MTVNNDASTGLTASGGTGQDAMPAAYENAFTLSVDEPGATGGDASANTADWTQERGGGGEADVYTPGVEGDERNQGDWSEPNAADKNGDMPMAGTLPSSPDGYELRTPDGFTADQNRMGEFRQILFDAKVPSESAQKMLDVYMAERKEIPKQVMNAFLTEVDRQKQEHDRKEYQRCQSDPEFGGAQFKRSCQYCSEAVRRFLPSQRERNEFDAFFQEAGLRNKHVMWKFLAAVGKATSEGVPANSSPASGREKSAAERMFPEFTGM